MIATFKKSLLPDNSTYSFICVCRDSVAVKNSFGWNLKIKKEVTSLEIFLLHVILIFFKFFNLWIIALKCCGGLCSTII